MRLNLKYHLFIILFINIFYANADVSVVNLADPSSSTRASSLYPTNSNYCWNKAEDRYGIPARLLVAIAKVETGLDPSIIGKTNKNGSYDIGLMQINSGWLPTLNKLHITKQDLFKPCTNIMVGAWILANNIHRFGYNWNAIGAYNAKTISKRGDYAKKVHQAIIELGYNI